MISGALLAAFVSGLAWSGLDVARKSLAREFAPSVVATCLVAGPAVLFGAWTALSSPSWPTAEYLRPASVSIVLSVAIQLLFLESVRRSELSRTIPMLSFTPVATFLFGAIVLGERPTPLQWIGASMVLAGALGLGFSRRSGARSILKLVPDVDAGALLMLAAALCISAAAPFDKLAVAATSTAEHGLFLSLFSGVVLLGFLAMRGELRQVGRAFAVRPATRVAAVLAFAALGLQFAAYQGAMVGVVETIKRVVGLASSLVAGRFIFDEAITKPKLGAVLLMALGVALMLR